LKDIQILPNTLQANESSIRLRVASLMASWNSQSPLSFQSYDRKGSRRGLSEPIYAFRIQSWL